MHRNEETRQCVGSGAPLVLTPLEVYELARKTDLPAGTYDLIDGIARLYGLDPFRDVKCRVLFAMSAAFVAGCVYNAGRGGAEL